MTESTRDGFKVELNSLDEKLKEVLHEGNVRRLIVKRDDQVGPRGIPPHGGGHWRRYSPSPGGRGRHSGSHDGLHDRDRAH